MSLQSVADVRSALDEHNYLASDGLATAVFLAISLNRPLLLEGEAGVGKTELAKVLATIRNSELIRLQCYEGIDAAQAMYDWDYSRQSKPLAKQHQSALKNSKVSSIASGF
jgi:MoxR-like ATPase